MLSPIGDDFCHLHFWVLSLFVCPHLYFWFSRMYSSSLFDREMVIVPAVNGNFGANGPGCARIVKDARS